MGSFFLVLSFHDVIAERRINYILDCAMELNAEGWGCIGTMSMRYKNGFMVMRLGVLVCCSHFVLFPLVEARDCLLQALAKLQETAKHRQDVFLGYFHKKHFVHVKTRAE